MLPTDARFKELTDEQIELLWENYLVDNPQIERSIKDRFENPFYEQMEKTLEVDINKIRLGNSNQIDRPIEIYVKPISKSPIPILKEQNAR